MPFFIKVKGSFHGKHYWPGAPECFAELGVLHEHDFGFVVEIMEEHPREIEFLLFAQEINEKLASHLQANPYLSCEEMARDLFRWLDAGRLVPPPVLPGRVASVEVNEDGDCGAIYQKGEV